jgi:hypothetical protein
MSGPFRIQLNGCDVYPNLHPNNVTGKPTFDRGTPIKEEADLHTESMTTMPQSRFLLKTITNFTKHAKFSSFTQEKIQPIFAKFTSQIKKMEELEGSNDILKEAQKLIDMHQKKIDDRKKTIKSELLFKQIETFTHTPGTLTLTQEKIQKTYDTFVERIQTVKKEEGSNPFLESALKFIEENRESTIKKGKDLVETEGPKPSPEEDKLFGEIYAFLNNPQTGRLSAEKLEQHLKDYESRLNAINDRPDDPSFGFKIKPLFIKLRTRITNTKLINGESSAPSSSSASMAKRNSRHNALPSLLASAQKIHNMTCYLVNNQISPQELPKCLIELDAEIPLQIGDETMMMPIGGLVLYHLTMVHLGKTPLSSHINDPDYSIKALEMRDGCSASYEDVTRALLRAEMDILIQGYKNTLKQQEIPILEKYHKEIRELVPILAPLGDAIPELETFGQVEGKNTVLSCMRYATEIRSKLRVQWNIV